MLSFHIELCLVVFLRHAHIMGVINSVNITPCVTSSHTPSDLVTLDNAKNAGDVKDDVQLSDDIQLVDEINFGDGVKTNKVNVTAIDTDRSHGAISNSVIDKDCVKRELVDVDENVDAHDVLTSDLEDAKAIVGQLFQYRLCVVDNVVSTGGNLEISEMGDGESRARKVGGDGGKGGGREEDGGEREEKRGGGVTGSRSDVKESRGRRLMIVRGDSGAPCNNIASSTVLNITYQVSQYESITLPDWLFLSQPNNVIEGVPQSIDAGKSFQIGITLHYPQCSSQIYCPDNCTTLKSGTDHFIIEVTNDTSSFYFMRDANEPVALNVALRFQSSYISNTSPTFNQLITCPRSSRSITIAAVVLKVHWSRLAPMSRIDLLRRFSDFLTLPVEMLRVVTDYSTSDILVGDRVMDVKILVAGGGDGLFQGRRDESQSLHEYEGTVSKDQKMVEIQWVVGCGSVAEEQVKVLGYVEMTAQDGSMQSSLSYCDSVIGWQVFDIKVTSKLTLRARRLATRRGGRGWRRGGMRGLRAGAAATSTLLPTLPPPSERPPPAFSILPTSATTKHSEHLSIYYVLAPSSRDENVQTLNRNVKPFHDSVVDDVELSTVSFKLSDQIHARNKPDDERTGSQLTERSIISIPDSESNLVGSAYEIGTVERVTSPSFLVGNQYQYSALPTSRSKGRNRGREQQTRNRTVKLLPSVEQIPSSKIIATEHLPVMRSTPSATVKRISVSNRFPASATAASPSNTESHENERIGNKNMTQSTKSLSSSTFIDKGSRELKALGEQNRAREEHGYNFPPIINKKIERLSVRVGEIFYYNLANDTFIDYEDGLTSSLTLVLLAGDGMSILPNSWVKLDKEKQMLYGMPLDRHVGRRHYILAAVDRGSKLAHDSFVIDVQPIIMTHQNISCDFSLVLGIDYQMFIIDTALRMGVARKIAAAFQDHDTRYIQVRRISPGSVNLTWTNNTLAPFLSSASKSSPFSTNNTLTPPSSPGMNPFPCPIDIILRLVRVLVDPPSDYDVINSPSQAHPRHVISINRQFAAYMWPYEVRAVGFRPLGACLDKMADFVTSSEGRVEGEVEAVTSWGEGVRGDGADEEDDVVINRKLAYDDEKNKMFIKIIVSCTVVILLLILLAVFIIIIFVRYGRRHFGRETKLDGDVGRGGGRGCVLGHAIGETTRGRGGAGAPPVIFSDEITDDCVSIESRAVRSCSTAAIKIKHCQNI